MRIDEKYFREKILYIFSKNDEVIDIGGGLKIDPLKNNRGIMNPWAIPISKGKYKILDKVSAYHPDIVGDIHSLPLKDESVSSMLCLDVLEHVEEPWVACKEMYRVLKPCGHLFIRVPFILYYHPEKGYYEDYYRFTKEGLRYLLKDFKNIEIVNIGGALGTIANLIPFFTKKTGFFDTLDKIFNKHLSEQTSGYYAFCIK